MTICNLFFLCRMTAGPVVESVTQKSSLLRKMTPRNLEKCGKIISAVGTPVGALKFNYLDGLGTPRKTFWLNGR